MCWMSKKKLQAHLEPIQNKIDKLTKIIETQELARLREESKLLKEQTFNLHNVRFRVKFASYFENDSGEKLIKICYDMPTIYLKVSDEGKIEHNDLFISINKLNLLDKESFAKIQRAVDQARKENIKIVKK